MNASMSLSRYQPASQFFALLMVGAVSWFFVPALTPQMKVAGFAYYCMVAGFLFRSRREVHMPLMLLAMAVDVSLVGYLEWNRAAIAQVVGLKPTLLQLSHVAFSTAAVVLYVPVVYLGVLRARGKSSRVQAVWHLRLGVAAFTVRSLGFAFMFSFLK